MIFCQYLIVDARRGVRCHTNRSRLRNRRDREKRIALSQPTTDDENYVHSAAATRRPNRDGGEVRIIRTSHDSYRQ